jgi:hypothetical protein
MEKRSFSSPFCNLNTIPNTLAGLAYLLVNFQIVGTPPPSLYRFCGFSLSSGLSGISASWSFATSKCQCCISEELILSAKYTNVLFARNCDFRNLYIVPSRGALFCRLQRFMYTGTSSIIGASTGCTVCVLSWFCVPRYFVFLTILAPLTLEVISAPSTIYS